MKEGLRDQLDAMQEREACNTPPRGYVFADKAVDAIPRIDEPPTLLAYQRDHHRQIGLALRDNALRLLEQSQQHLAASQGFERARRRLLEA